MVQDQFAISTPLSRVYTNKGLLLTVRLDNRDHAYRSFSEFGASIPILGLSQIQVWSDKNKRQIPGKSLSVLESRAHWDFEPKRMLIAQE